MQFLASSCKQRWLPNYLKTDTMKLALLFALVAASAAFSLSAPKAIPDADEAMLEAMMESLKPSASLNEDVQMSNVRAQKA
jgi:hypothetical protein